MASLSLPLASGGGDLAKPIEQLLNSRSAGSPHAYENAAAQDVYLLINEIKQKVYDEFGVRLKEEVEYLGEF